MKELRLLIQGRLDAGVSLRSIARDTDIIYKSLYNYYHGKAEPTGRNLVRLALYFNVPVMYLLSEYLPDNDLTALQLELGIMIIAMSYEQCAEISRFIKERLLV